MLATVAIQSPRISRWSAGAAVSPGGGTIGGLVTPDPEQEAPARTARPSRRQRVLEGFMADNFGRFSIYEKSDELGTSCEPLFALAKAEPQNPYLPASGRDRSSARSCSRCPGSTCV